MMGVGPEECGRLTLWEYGALLWNWNQAHSGTGSSHEPASPEFRDQMKRIFAAEKRAG
jgi:hypothetical protein